MKEKVLNYLRFKNKGQTPTEIGIELGFEYNNASSSVAYSLKRLVQEGLVVTYKTNGKVLYKINNDSKTT